MAKQVTPKQAKPKKEKKRGLWPTPAPCTRRYNRKNPAYAPNAA